MKTIVIFFILLFCNSSFAFKVSPMVDEFAPIGRDATRVFLLDNSGKDAVSIEIEATTRAIDKDGKELRTKTEDFVIYPMQLSLKKDEKRNIRVTWTGAGDVKTELPYRLIFRQLPVNAAEIKTDTAGVKLNFIYEYVASIYITPKGVSPKLLLSSLTKKEGKAIVVFENTGTKHLLLTDYKIIFESKKKNWPLPDSELEKNHVSNLLPGDKRKLEIDLPSDMKNSDVKLSFTNK